MLDVETEAVATSIHSQVAATSKAAKSIQRGHVNGVRSAIEKAEVTLDRVAGQFMDGLDELSSTARGGFAEAGDKVVGEIATIGANVRGGLAGLSYADAARPGNLRQES